MLNSSWARPEISYRLINYVALSLFIEKRVEMKIYTEMFSYWIRKRAKLEMLTRSFECKCSTTAVTTTAAAAAYEKIHLLYNGVYDTNEYLVYCKPELRYHSLYTIKSSGKPIWQSFRCWFSFQLSCLVVVVVAVVAFLSLLLFCLLVRDLFYA